MKNLLVRTVSGFALAVVMLGAIIWSQWSFGALMLVLTIGGILEFYTLAEKRGAAPQKFLGLAMGVLILLITVYCAFYCGFDVPAHGGTDIIFVCASAALFLLPFVMFICELYRKRENPVANIGVTIMGVCYVAVPFALMCLIPMLGAKFWDPWMLIFYILIIWANDVFAYLVGMTIGKHRLFERLSPKKSWEGFFGGLAGAVAMGVGAAYALDANVWAWAGLALVAAVAGVFGDLAESMFKRAAETKDSGALIPGHGGVLDRFDAMLLSAPFVFVYMLFIL